MASGKPINNEPFKTIETRVSELETLPKRIRELEDEVGLVPGPSNPLAQNHGKAALAYARELDVWQTRTNNKIVDLDNRGAAALAKANAEIEILKKAFDQLKARFEQRVSILEYEREINDQIVDSLLDPPNKRTLRDRLFDACAAFKE